jgi:hypothetical protein
MGNTKPEHFSLERVIRSSILSLKPYRCARDDYDQGILLDANENSLGSSLSPTDEAEKQGKLILLLWLVAHACSILISTALTFPLVNQFFFFASNDAFWTWNRWFS